MRRLGVIDIGSNSIRSTLVEVQDAGTLVVLDDERDMVRLSSGLDSSCCLSEKAIQKALTSLKRMQDIADAHGVHKLSAIATSAVRKARNREDFIARVQDEVGLKVEIITGKEEARLAFESAAQCFDFAKQPSAVIDLGGGSTEIILSIGKTIDQIYSLPMGAVGFSRQFLTDEPVRPKAMRQLQKKVRSLLAEHQVYRDMTLKHIVISGGTANALAKMKIAQMKKNDRSVQGFAMTLEDIQKMLQELVECDLEERKKIPGLNTERADIIVGGVTIICEVLQYLDGDRMVVNSRGIRHGLLQRMVDKDPKLGKEVSFLSRTESVEAFSKDLLVDVDHARQVRKLALMIYDQIKGDFRLKEESRDLLAAAAYLHDIGDLVAHKDHHKHSYHIIANSALSGFSPQELEMVAQIARYHRGSLPKRKHAWGALEPDSREIVSQLGGILRIADGLDRQHAQVIKRVRCKVADQSMRINLVGHSDPAVEIYGALKKIDLFEESFGCSVHIGSE